MITVSAGHWGIKTGANGLIDEGTENIKVSKRVTEILRAAGIVTNYIQDTVNKSQSANVNWLVAEHNRTTRKIDLQVHFNSMAKASNKGTGVEILIYDEKYYAQAKKIVDAIAEVSGLKNRGVKIRKDLGFLRGTNKPAFLLEVCFVNDSVDVAIYRRDFEKICQAIANELAKAVGKTLKPSTGNTVAVDNDVHDRARKLIKQAVKDKHFSGAHESVNEYNEAQLLKYVVALAEKLI